VGFPLRTTLLLLCVAVVVCMIYNTTWAPLPSSPSSRQAPETIASAVASSPLPASDRLPGPPTVTASFIDQVLALAHSPASGLGEVMYSLGVQSHIDPVFALAFFHHESDYGKAGVAVSTLSMGNIRCSSGYACLDGYRAYRSWAASVADWYLLMRTVYLAQGLETVEQIIPVYAPRADGNDEQAYIMSVLSDVIRWREGEVQT
jgi:hypothetical protein